MQDSARVSDGGQRVACHVVGRRDSKVMDCPCDDDVVGGVKFHERTFVYGQPQETAKETRNARDRGGVRSRIGNTGWACWTKALSFRPRSYTHTIRPRCIESYVGRIEDDAQVRVGRVTGARSRWLRNAAGRWSHTAHTRTNECKEKVVVTGDDGDIV